MMEGKNYCYRYPHPAVTADCVIFGFDGKRLQILLIKRGGEPYKGKWAFPGGFVNEDESVDEGAMRELREETGMEAEYLEQFHVYSAPDRDPRERVITVAFYALVKLTDVRGGDDASEAAWFGLDEVPALAFDHDEILRDALRRLRERIYFSLTGHDRLPDEFSLSELQTIYETIAGNSPDRER